MATPSSLDRDNVPGAETSYVPQAFAIALVAEEDRPATACASCPAAIWYKQPEWRCFCNIMKFQSWTSQEEPIPVCDGREASLAKYNEALKGIDQR